MSHLHILRAGRGGKTEWKTASDHYTNVTPDEKIITECCVCRMRADECDVQILLEPEWSYMEPVHKIRCKKGFGCDANPRKKCGATLRSWSHYGP